MRLRGCTILLAGLVGAAVAHAETKPEPKTALPKVVTWQLANGLKVIFQEEHKAPVVTVQVFYNVGGKDEPQDKRGIAHMFEHMMFKGSKHVPPEEHARYIDAVGGRNNAFTTDDVTGYHDTVPPAFLNFALELEAERMRNLVLTQKTVDSEREVVKEELRLRLENNPIMKALNQVLQLSYTVHPYRISAIGSKKMLDTVTVDDCKRFYETFYRPNNASLIIVGDVDEASARKLVDAYFATLEKGPVPPRTNIVEPPQTALRETTLSMPVQLPVMIGAYHIPPAASDDIYALEVLQELLSSGESSRLYRRLVRKDRLAVAAGGFVFDHKDPGLFVTFAAYLPTADAKKIRAVLDEEIAKISQHPVDAKELQKAKNQLATASVFHRERVEEVATQMGIDGVVAGDPMRSRSAEAKYDALTANDLSRVAKKYLVPSNLSIVTLLPKAGDK